MITSYKQIPYLVCGGASFDNEAIGGVWEGAASERIAWLGRAALGLGPKDRRRIPFMVHSPTNTFDVIERNATLHHKCFDMDAY